MLDWNVAIYCANEGARLQGCLDSVTAALGQRKALITVILNGSSDDSLDIARGAERAGQPIEVFRIAGADKSNAINQFYHVLRSPARAYAGVDGYAHVGAHAFETLERRLDTDRHAVAVTGIARTGRTMLQFSSEALISGGRLHGQLHALRPDFLDRMVSRNIRLPIGLYRGDGLLGSMAAHNLDPLTVSWDNARVPAEAEATYSLPAMSPFRPQDLQRQFRRKIRQMRGSIENAAIKEIIYKKGYEGLPDSADDMLRQHVATYGLPRVAAVDRLFQRLALRQLAREVPPDPADLLAHRAP